MATISYDESVLEALCFGWIDGKVQTLDETFYQRRFTPRQAKSPWSPTNKRRVAALEGTGLMTPAGQAAIDAAHASGTWDAPDPDMGSEIPSGEFAEALAANPKARAGFDGLTPGRKREYVRWIRSAKREETRLRRIAKALPLLEEGKGLGMM